MAQFQAFETDELEWIKSIQDKNDKTEDYFKSCREKIEDDIKPLVDYGSMEFNAKNAHKIMETQLVALGYRQNYMENISFYLNKISKENVKMKKLKQDKLIWYAIGSPLSGKKFSGTQMTELIEAHTAELQRSIELLEVHVDFLRQSAKGLDNLGYFIKNMIEYYNLVSKNY